MVLYSIKNRPTRKYPYEKEKKLQVIGSWSQKSIWFQLLKPGAT